MNRILPTTLLFASLLAGCASTGRFGRTANEVVIFPTPPDTARVQFLLTLSTDTDVRGRRSGFFSSFFRGGGPSRGIIKAYGVDFHDGRFYVCDTMLPGVHIIDVAEQTMGQLTPRGRGTLRTPVNCFVDRETDRLYVADTGREQVVVFESDGTYVTAFGDDVGVPSDVTVEGDRIWVADLGAAKIRAYDKASHELLMSFPDDGGDVDVPLRQPINLAVRDGLVYVSDFGDFSVKIYDTDGHFVRRIGRLGTGLGQFARPKGISVDREGRIYVVDAAFENVQIFSPEGELLLFFGGAYQGPGTMWLPAKVRVVEEGLELFEGYVDPEFDLDYLILVTNQYGPDRLSVYGFVSAKQGPS